VIARPGDDLEEEDDGGQDQRWSEPMQSDENATFDYRQNSAHDPGEHALAVSVAGRYDTPAKSETSSPMKVVSTPYSSTPGLSRRIQMDRYTSMRSSTPQQSSALRDITTTRQGTQAETPFTPSPLKMDSTAGDFATPRPLLDDAERRKSHVLAVLNSTSVPSRNMRPAPKGTPHPLRRVSLAATSESVTERGSPMASNLTSTMTPGSRTRHSIDATQTQSANESFVSIASSADLTSDRRATKIASRLSRGNTSFPTILLPTNAAMPSPGGSLKGLSDHRADGVKIHKHLNAMNKQLLETNADLAREAEAWRDEVERLKELLKDHGVQVEEVDIEALVQAGGESLATTGERWQKDSPSDSGGFSRHHDRQFGSPDLLRSQLSASKAHLPTHASSQDPLEGLNPHEHAAVMLEMAERLEALEEGLDDKDRMITELQQELGAAKSSGAAEPQDHIDELHRQLEEGERMRVALHSEFVLKTEQHAKRFGEICSGFEEQVKSLEAQLAVAKSETERLRAEKSRIEAFTCKDGLNDREKEWRKQLSGLKLDLSRTKEEARAHAGEVESLRKHSKLLEAERSELARMAEAAHIRVIELEARVAGAELGSEDARALRTEIDEARAGRLAASDDMAQVEHTIKDLHKINSDQEAELERQFEQIEKLSQRVLGLELALDAAAGDRRQADGELMAEVNRLREALQDAEDDLADKEAELAVAHRKIATQDVQAILDHTAPPPSRDEGERRDQEQRGLMQALEQQLDNAFREIGRLKHEISTTPHRVSSIEMRDARIKALEREKAALTERLASVRSTSASPPLHGGMQTAGSPFNRPTPFAHKAIASLRTPKTPGPLKDVSTPLCEV